MSFVTHSGLAKSFGATTMFRDIDLAGEQGEVCTLVGPLGCGKTTLWRAVASLVAPDQGQIRICSQPVHGRRRTSGASPPAFAAQWCVILWRCRVSR